MKALRALVKIHKNNIDGLNRRLAEQYISKAKIDSRIESLRQQASKEIELAQGKIEYAGVLGEYLLFNKRESDQCVEHSRQLQVTIDKILDAIYAEFIEKKRIEIVLAQQKLAQSKEEVRRDICAIDETVTLRYSSRSI